MAPNRIKTIVRVRPTLRGEPRDDGGVSVDSQTEVTVVNPRETKSTYRFKFASVRRRECIDEQMLTTGTSRRMDRPPARKTSGSETYRHSFQAFGEEW